MLATRLYTEAYNASLVTQLTPEGIAKLGETDGRKDARSAIRKVSGRVDATAALANIREQFPHLFSEEKNGKAEKVADSIQL